MAILRVVGLLCIVIFQLSSCLSGPKRAKREFDVDEMPDRMIDNFERILKELTKVVIHVQDVNDSLIEHIQGHVENKLNKLDHLEDLMKHVINRQRYFELCRMNENSCENGGTCYVEMGVESYSCACPDGWIGDRCQEDERCVDMECFNKGVCINGTCHCIEGFFGHHCDVENDCRDREHGLHPTSDCRFFLLCYKSWSTVQICPHGTIVNPKTSKCDIPWPDNEDCP